MHPSSERHTMSEHVMQLSDSTFDEQIGSASGAVVVDFWAEWCGPCKQIAPILDEIALENPGLTVAKLNIDDNFEVTRRYGAQGLPPDTITVALIGSAGQSLGAFLPPGITLDLPTSSELIALP